MFDLVSGPQRLLLKADAAQAFIDAGALVIDHRRSRPFWFDGRFLAARDLNREQQYFLSRQADLGDAAGSGVAEGLTVTADTQATRVRIAPGHGVCTGGATVLIAPVPQAQGSHGDLVVDLAELPGQALLNRALDRGDQPGVPDALRSGLFVLALRPIEFTANPVGRYPSQPGETTTAQDGEVIEAVLITLIPFPEPTAYSNEHLRRSSAARRVHLDAGWRPPANCLPLALLALDRNQVLWCDTWLLRRRLGEDRVDPLGLGQAPRPAREAFFIQYQHHLEALLAERERLRQGSRFAASEHFVVLPPAGRLPAGAFSLAEDRILQHFFPAEMDVDLAAIPEDELPTVVEESFLLPPIALDAPAEERACTGVLALLPLPRAELRNLPRRRLPLAKPILTGAVPFGRASAEILREIPWLRARERLARNRDNPDSADTMAEQTAADLAHWRSLLARAPALWYVRRRTVSYKDSLAGVGAVIAPDLDGVEDALTGRLREAGLGKAQEELFRRSTTAARKKMVEGLARSGELVARATLNALRDKARLDQATVDEALAGIADGETDELIKRVEDAVLEPERKSSGTISKVAVERNRVAREKLADRDTVANLARLARAVEPAAFDAMAAELKEALRDQDAATVKALVAKKAEGLG